MLENMKKGEQRYSHSAQGYSYQQCHTMNPREAKCENCFARKKIRFRVGELQAGMMLQ